jgi:hypothetical protein
VAPAVLDPLFGGWRFQSALIETQQGNSFCRPKAAKSQLENPEMVMIYLVA